MNKIYFVLLLLISFTSFGQNTITGSVKDESSGEPLPGSTVAIKGAGTGTSSDAEGNFSLPYSGEFPFTLVFEFAGYTSKEIEIYEVPEVPLVVRLKNSSVLEEVVVVGYGEQKRKDITGAVAAVPIELKSQPVASVERLLQGSVAGAIVTQTSGQPGGGVSVQIRGNNSITAASDPLYVIDGFPINNDYSVTDAGVTDRDGVRLNPLSSLNTADIENIDVLKDASATAIYGSRGANGVVIITTKKGKRGESTINYDGYYGVQDVIRTIPVLNASEWWQLRKDATSNTPNGKAPTLPEANNFKYDTTGAGTDWQKAGFQQAAIQSHNISIFTGGEKTRLAFSGNYFNQQGVLLGTDFKRYAGRVNVEHEFNDKFKVSSYITASQTASNIAPQAIVTGLLLTSPAIPVYDNNGNFVKNTSTDSPLQNPINSLTNQINESQTSRLLANIAGDYKISNSLTARVLFGTDVIINKQNRYLPNSTYEGNPSAGSGTGGIATVGSLFTTSWLNENTLNYTKLIGKKHSINAVGGFTAQVSDSRGYIASSATFGFDQLDYNALQNGSGTRAPSSSASAWQLASYLGRVNYVLSDKYLFTLTFRADGSSRFGNENKWGYFPSAAVGWNVDKENFLKNIAAISNLKVRLSAGNTGNQGIAPYSSISQIAPYRYNFSNVTFQGYAPNSVNNAGLGWEKNIPGGFRSGPGLLNNRINITADYYNKRTTNLLLNAPVPGTSGLSFYDPVNNISQNSFVYQNIGEVENKGFELSLNTQNVKTKKFNWNTIFIFSNNQNKIISLGGGLPRLIPNINQPSVLEVGAPVGSFYVYQSDGVIQTGEEGTKALTPQANKTVGGQKYKDINGDGVITQAGDRVLVKNNPGINLGFTNTFKYTSTFGSIDLTVFLQSSIGGKLYNQNRATLELGTGFYNGSKEMLNRYSSGNTGTDVKEAYQDPAVTVSDRFIEDASYLRLKNLTLGYNLPESLLKHAKIKGLRIYASTQNILTWTKYTGFDPEASQTGQTLINKGIDNGVYPNSKSVLAGLSLTF